MIRTVKLISNNVLEVDVKQKLPKTGSNKIMELFLTVTGIGLLLTLKGLKYYGKDK
ncbi:hypothetical protein [Streptococcus pneumoniae]|uniref:hypothetical protein n=1 Tax=Streptococcus pneumoniae TaxID=1313 RepID=UPI0015D73C6F|nr:hypothetical protein [Streptococcus pneumoniae]